MPVISSANARKLLGLAAFLIVITALGNKTSRDWIANTAGYVPVESVEKTPEVTRSDPEPCVSMFTTDELEIQVSIPHMTGSKIHPSESSPFTYLPNPSYYEDGVRLTLPPTKTTPTPGNSIRPPVVEVPEPATLVIMSVGLGVLGYLLRKRK